MVIIDHKWIMRYYKVFHSCQSWEELASSSPEVAAAGGKSKGEVIGIFMHLAAGKDVAELTRDLEELAEEGFRIKSTPVRAMIDQVIGALDGDGSGKVSATEVVRFWKAFDPSVEEVGEVPENVRCLVGLSKEEAATSIQSWFIDSTTYEQMLATAGGEQAALTQLEAMLKELNAKGVVALG